MSGRDDTPKSEIAPRIQAVLDKKMSVRELLGISDRDLLDYAAGGIAFLEQGKLQNAQEVFEGLVELNPDEPDYFALLASTYLAQEKCPEAVEAFSKAIALDPPNRVFRLHRAQAAIKLDQAAAMADLNFVISTGPKPADAMTKYASEVLKGTGTPAAEPPGPPAKPAAKAKAAREMSKKKK